MLSFPINQNPNFFSITFSSSAKAWSVASSKPWRCRTRWRLRLAGRWSPSTSSPVTPSRKTKSWSSSSEAQESVKRAQLLVTRTNLSERTGGRSNFFLSSSRKWPTLAGTSFFSFRSDLCFGLIRVSWPQPGFYFLRRRRPRRRRRRFFRTKKSVIKIIVIITVSILP